jgi:patatin-like phospholipase/acyl hydrolase
MAAGARGLSALIILEQLMQGVDPDAPPKPCDYFDMIGGTETGGRVLGTKVREEHADL